MNENEFELVSVLMATNRADDYLDKAINSVLHQTYKNIELVIIANGDKKQIINDYIREKFIDSRITIIMTSIPQLGSALNIGIDHCKGRYIARMDADDICLSNRIELQIKYIKDHDIDILGGAITRINESESEISSVIYPNSKDIKNNIYYKNPFAHSSVMYRKQSIIKLRGYNAGFNSEDYDLWLRANRMKMRMDNMPNILIRYRVHSASTQNNPLGYAEVVGHMIREALLTKNINAILGVILSIAKYIKSIMTISRTKKNNANSSDSKS